MNRIKTLDGWRAVAILMVTAFHAGESIWSDHTAIAYYSRFGALGVDVFFALSGLLITKLLLEERDRTGRISLKAFYIRRCCRVLMPCYCYLAVLVIFSAVNTGTELASSVFFFRNYLDADYHGYYTSHLWSLAVEEHFYLIWPIALVWATPRYGRQVAMWGAVSCALWRVASSSWPSSAFPLFRTDYRLDSLLWGCVIGFVLHERPVLKGITRAAWLGILAGYLLCLRFYSPLARLWMPMLLPLLILGTLTHTEWRLSKILETAPLKWIGKISYSLYLWQMIFLVQNTHSPHWWQRFPENILLAFTVSALSYYMVDAPLQRAGCRIAKRVAAAVPRRLLAGPPMPVLER